MRIISYKTYQYFARKYKIPLTRDNNGKRVKKSFEELQKEIFDYEKKNEHIKKGLYYE